MQWQRKLPPLLQEESPQSRLCASAEQPFPISVFSLYRRQEHRATGTRKFFLAISPCIWYSVSVSICRCVGIGRRGGLKIHWANPPCGFDPRHRHHICSEVSCFGAFLLPRSKVLNIFRKRRENCICRRNLTGKIQMCVNIGSSADVAVSQPLLNLFQAHTIGIQQTGTAMSQIMKERPQRLQQKLWQPLRELD